MATILSGMKTSVAVRIGFSLFGISSCMYVCKYVCMYHDYSFLSDSTMTVRMYIHKTSLYTLCNMLRRCE